MNKPNKYAAAAEQARKETDEKYRQVIATLTRLSEEDVERLFPTRTDKDRLLELLDIVNQETDDNIKVARLKEDIESYGTIILKLISLLT